MSLLVAALAAAGVGLAAGGVAMGRWLQRRARQARGLRQAAPRAPRPGQLAPSGWVPLELGEVVRLEDETRWLTSCLQLFDGQQLGCTLWFTTGDAGEPAVASFPVPARHLYWLDRSDALLPPEPPTRLELAGRFLDRVGCFPAAVTALRRPPLVPNEAVVALYEGAIGDAALLLSARSGGRLYAGRRVEQAEYDCMGRVAPEDADALAGQDGIGRT